MSEITIRSIESKKDIDKFLKFAWKIYEGNKNWVPPLLYDKKKILDKKKNPFYKHAEMELFVAEKNGEIVGRIAAIKNDRHNEYHHDKVGFWGFFECINNQNAADKLFDAAKNWLKERGLTEMRGPASPSSNDEYGMLIEGFDDPPRILMSYNPKYYLELCDNYGMKKAKDLFAWKMTGEGLEKADKVKRVAEIASKRAGLKIRSLNMKKFNEELELFKQVYNAAWAPNWGFVPLTDEEIDAMAADLKPLVEPHLVIFGEIDGKVVGAALTMPDYNEIFIGMNGRLLPFNWIKLFTRKKKITWSRIITLGIIPEYQKKGLDAAFYYETFTRARDINIHKGEASWILEDNDMMNRGSVAMNASVYKKYRIYSLEF